MQIIVDAVTRLVVATAHSEPNIISCSSNGSPPRRPEKDLDLFALSHAQVIALFVSAILVSGVYGNPLSVWIMAGSRM
ncbi:hypothetical protein [Streptomyces sp. NPDC001665]